MARINDSCEEILNNMFHFRKQYVRISNDPRSEARQFLQPAQYCASCILGVMLVLPVNTVPNIGILLAYYWRGTGVVFFCSTGETLKLGYL